MTRPVHHGASDARALVRALLLCVLGVCVLCWGTAYKCSLYKSLQEQARTPVAKLDTRGSDAARVQVDHSVQPEAEPARLLLTVLLPAPAPQRWPVQQLRPTVRLQMQRTPALFFRPPPASLFASA